MSSYLNQSFSQLEQCFFLGKSQKSLDTFIIISIVKNSSVKLVDYFVEHRTRQASLCGHCSSASSRMEEPLRQPFDPQRSRKEFARSDGCDTAPRRFHYTVYTQLKTRDHRHCAPTNIFDNLRCAR